MPLTSKSVAMSSADSSALAMDPSDTILAADPLGRFVYHESHGVSSYRVDASGALTLASQTDANLWGRLVPTPEHLYLGTQCQEGIEPDYVPQTFWLSLLPVDASGILGAPARLVSSRCGDWSGRRYHTFLTADPERDVFYTYRLGDVIAAEVLDSTPGSGGHREVALLDLMHPGGGLRPIELDDTDEPYLNACLAARGLLFLVDDHTHLYSFDLIHGSAGPAVRGFIPQAAEHRMRIAYAPPGILAVATPHQSVPPDYRQVITGIHLYRVGDNGDLSVLGAVPEGSFQDIRSFAFHPSGRFLYVAGIASDRLATTGSAQASDPSQTLSLFTFLVGPDGTPHLFGSVPVSAYDQKTYDRTSFGMIAVTAPP